MNAPVRILYQTLAHGFYLVSAPYFLFRMARSERYRAGLSQRLGRLPSALAEIGRRRPIWIHSVSVGETRSMEPVVERLHGARPEIPIVMSTVTRTGQVLAQRLPHVAATIYLPLELDWIVGRVFRIVHPRLLVLVDTEMWPTLVSRAGRSGVPVMLANGRVSDRSWPRYRRLRWFFAPLFGGLARVLAQSETDRERLVALGAAVERTSVSGSTKYDAVPARDAELRARWRARFGLSPDEILIVAGSTFPGEEALIVSAAAGLSERVRLLVAPRHPERAEDVIETVQRAGRRPLRLSRWEGGTLGPRDVLIVDTLGQLREIYAAADLAVIGKSFRAHGGQNPIEPASQAVPTLTGPHMENFREAMAVLLEAGGVLQLSGEHELPPTLARLSAAPEECRRLGENAWAALQARRGAADRVVEEILGVLDAPSAGAP
ncbi:3-deoxy-D-manno-octulosonic acid transferase [bacterium]|nr:3-deoxy-D-manno-octulosonic acid transferase [bacterium]